MSAGSLYGVSESRNYGANAGHPAEVASAEMLALGADVPISISRPNVAARPVSPGTIEKAASLLRSLSFAAGRPAAGESAEERAAAYAAVGAALRREMRSDSMERLHFTAPALAQRLQSALLASCGALLGAQHPDGGFEWAIGELEDLAKGIPAATSGVFPGAYYFEIFGSDVAALGRAVSSCRQTKARSLAMAENVLALLARPGVGPAELHGAGRSANELGLTAEAAAAAAVGELAEREERARVAHEGAAAEAREARRNQKEAEAATARVERQLADEQRRRAAADDDLGSTRAALQAEEEVRRKVEAASVRTLQELRTQEEARWEAERRAQAESVRAAEFEALARRAQEEGDSRASAAEGRDARSTAEAKTASQRYVEAERMRVALQGRVAALDGVKTQLEQQLKLEREACATELSLRQQAEAAMVGSQNALAEAQDAAAGASGAAAAAKVALEQASGELAASEERLRVANDGSLQQHMASASAEDAVAQLKALRADDAAKMQRLNAERASLTQRAAELEERINAQAAAAERATTEAGKQRYELHAQLTEVHRRCEDLQAQATRAELMLQHERETGLTTSDAEKRLAQQLDAERRAKQALAQQLAAEAALRQKSDAQESGTAKELQAREQEAKMQAQRLQATQTELYRAREDARASREAGAEARAIAQKLEREREAEREEARRAGNRQKERDARGPPAASSRPRPPTPPSLQQHLGGGPAFGGALGPDPAGGLGAGASHPAQPRPQPAIADELSRSDIWNFSNGALARGRNAGGPDLNPGSVLPRIKSPYSTQQAPMGGAAGGVGLRGGGLGGLGTTSLAPDDARALYGMDAPRDEARA